MDRLDAVWSSQLSAADGQAYDRFVAAARDGHYSQTRAWAKLATASKPFAPIYFLARRDGRVVAAALVLRTKLLLPLPVAQIERGPVCDDPNCLPEVLVTLLHHARAHGILRLSVMPYWSGEEKPLVEEILRRQGFADRQTFGGRHARTLRLDLAQLPDDETFAGRALHQVRQNIRRAERAGAIARQGRKEDLTAFRAMHEQLLDGKQPPAAAWYDALAAYFLSGNEQGAMFVCEHQGSIVSAIFVARHGKHATYLMGASSAEAVRFPKMILPLAAAIAWTKQNGGEFFDLGGIPLEGDIDVKRASIAEFKYSFSHNEIALVHEHVRWF
jgi:lipid II:glycine glycyltransferase (peptidoglycan interpeptide bridge formation enzyme)